MTTVTDDNAATPVGRAADASAVERALTAALQDSARVGELLEELSRGRLWVPLPDDGRPVTDGSAITLPTVTYLGRDFIPAFTSAGRLPGCAAEPGRAEPARVRPPRVVPHVVVSLRTSGDAMVLTGPPAGTWPASYTVWMASPLQ